MVYKNLIPIAKNPKRICRYLKLFIFISENLICILGNAQLAYEVKHVSIDQGLSNNSVKSIFQDSKGFMWFGTCNGLNRYDGHLLKVFGSRLSDSTSPPDNYIHSINEDLDHNIWVGYGLLQYRTGKRAIDLEQSDYLNEYRGKCITSVIIEKQKTWIGIEGGGIRIINTVKNTKQRFNLKNNEQSELGSSSTVTLFLDKENRKWIGSLTGGIDYIEEFKNPFKVVRRGVITKNGLISNNVSCFAELDSDHLLIGTDGGGLSLWNRKTNLFTNYSHRSDQKNSLINSHVTFILKDHQGITWIGTYGGGISRYDQEKGIFKHYRCTVPGHGDNNYPWLLLEDHNMTLFVSALVGGYLYKYDPKADAFKLFDKKLINVISLAEDSKNSLWAGDSRFLTRIDQKSKRHDRFDIGNPVRAIFEDKLNQFWLGTENGGLVLFDRGMGKIKSRFSDVNGLCNNSVFNILEDNSGNFWLSTFNGLSRFDTKTKSFRNYYAIDGLSSNQFSYNSALKLKSGEMVFGGIDGFTVFHPDSLKKPQLAPALPYFESIRIDDIFFDSTGKYLSIDQNGKNKLILPYDKTLISLSVSSIDFNRSGERRYVYFLEGKDRNWISGNSSITINYSDLDPGSYSLHVRSNNGISGIGVDNVLLEIKVLPPFYKKWWAYLILIALIAIALQVYNIYRMKQSDFKHNVMLSIQNAKKDQETNERKLKFFTEIAHEFRTPLTLIINPLREFLKRNANMSQIDEIQRVYTNAKRLLVLADQLLLFQKAGANSHRLNITKLRFDLVCKDVFMSFTDQARVKKLKFTLNMKSLPIELYADREKIEVILYNLLSNAVKFTPEGGAVILDIFNDDRCIKLILSDSGPGIPKDTGDKLFEQFYQVQETYSSAGNGFGLGLYLVKHFIDLHQGLIHYDSSVGAGTSFHITLIKGSDHFRVTDIYNETVTLAPTDKKNVKIAKPEKTGMNKVLDKQKSLLIVEDNHELRDFLCGILQDNYIVYTALSGNRGFEMAKKQLPDLIISDIIMDDGNGLDLCRKIKNDITLGHIPIILLTAVSDIAVKLKGAESGADDYITKPFDADLLMARIKTLLQNRSKLQDYFFNEITLKKHEFNVPPEYTHFLEKCINIINNHLSEEDFNIKKLSSEIGMSHSAIYRRVKLISEESIASFIRFIRLRKAAELMITTDYTVNEIAFRVGMGDQKYFRIKFNGLFGLNPSEYIRKYRPESAKKSLRK
jgi:signal transduction histidine kinase/DNA-binding NarL/FixJ family response regulator/streptogramin lyase